MEKEKRVKAWKNYIEALVRDERPNIETEANDSLPYILIEEVEKAIQNGKDGKASRPNGSHSELLELLNDKSINIFAELST